MHQLTDLEILKNITDLQSKIRNSGAVWWEFEPMVSQLEKSVKHLIDLKACLDKSTILAVTDHTGTIMNVNDKFCEISGYSREELIGKNHRILKSGYHDQVFFRHLWKTISGGRIWSGEIKNRAKNGSYYWVMTTIVPIVDEHNKPLQYVALRTDITREKEKDEQLRIALQNDFHRIVNILPNLVFRLREHEDGSLIYTLFEGNLAKKMGFRSGEAVGKSPRHIFPEHLAVSFEQYYRRAFQGEHVTYDYRYKEGYYQSTLSPLLDERGQLVEVIGSTSDITDLKKAELTMRQMAFYDPITHLPNHRLFLDDLKDLLSQRNSDRKLAIMFMDLEHFKQINDAFGHRFGDEVLCEVSRRLAGVPGPNRKIYRLGNDEFLILLPDSADEKEITGYAEEILNQFEKPFRLEQYEFYISAAIGICCYSSGGKEDKETLLKNADTALLYAKKMGGNSYRFYQPEMKKAYMEQMVIGTELRKALDQNHLLLYYQPKVSVRDGHLTGVEALVRWNHPKWGMVLPGTFIPVAEEMGLISKIGEWVLREVCRQKKQWIDAGYPPFRLALNISALEFQRPDFYSRMVSILHQSGLSPEYLEFEITENSLMQNTEESIKVLSKLKELGVFIAIDDFGTGYSSLSYLKRFPINALKIDQSFVRDILSSYDDEEIVNAVIALAHNLNLKVVAEGVENEKVFEYLREKKCDEIQGYYISPPLSAQDFERKYFH